MKGEVDLLLHVIHGEKPGHESSLFFGIHAHDITLCRVAGHLGYCPGENPWMITMEGFLASLFQVYLYHCTLLSVFLCLDLLL